MKYRNISTRQYQVQGWPLLDGKISKILISSVDSSVPSKHPLPVRIQSTQFIPFYYLIDTCFCN